MLNTILKSSRSGRAQFSKNAILCSIISCEIFSLFNDMDGRQQDCITQSLIPMNQSLLEQKTVLL